VQNFAVQKVVSYLETKIKTPVDIKRVSLKLPKLLVLEGVYFEDQKSDTLIAGDTLLVDISLLKLLDNKVEINELDFRGITANITRTLPDSAFNFDYIVRAFATEEVQEEPQDTTSAMAFSIDKINLDRIRLTYKDDVIGTNADFYLGHLDTRIKTFDLPNMRFEVPNIVIDGINTKVKQWKVATTDDIPSTSQLGVESAVGEEAGMPDFKLGSADFKNIKVVYEDEASAMNAQVAFKRLAVNFEDLDLRNENIKIDDFLLEDSDSRIVFQTATAPVTTASVDTSESDSMDWVVSASDINLKNTNVQFDDNTSARLNKGLDYAHMKFSNLNLDLEDLFFSMDSISGNLDRFDFKEKSGLEITKFETEFTYTNTGVLLNDLILQTPNTLLRDNITISYPSLAALSENPELIELDISLDRGTLGMKDIVLLVPTLDTMEVMKLLLNKSFEIDAALNGSLADLNIPKFRVSTLDDTYLNVSGNVKNAMDPASLFANITIEDLRSSNRDLNRLIAKSMLPPDIDIPASIRLRGKFNGGMNNFRTNMALNTSVGNADLAANYIASRDTSYSAKINIQNLDVGSFMKNDTTIGRVSFAATVAGKSLDPRSMIAKGQAQLISAEAMGYTYKGINLDFNANAGDILANLISTDPNIRLVMNAQANWKDKYPALLLNLNIDSINTKNLNLTQDEIRYRGQLEADLATADPDFLNGSINLVNSSLSYNGTGYALDTIRLVSEATDSLKSINVESEFLNATLFGNYKLTQLGAAIQDVIATYYNPTNTISTAS